MPLLNSAVQIAANPFPRAISPKAHAIIDYLTVGSFLMTAAWFWGRSKRAALAALISGGAELAVSLLTNYPGGVKKVTNFRTHRDIDFGLGALTATMPEFLAVNKALCRASVSLLRVLLPSSSAMLSTGPASQAVA